MGFNASLLMEERKEKKINNPAIVMFYPMIVLTLKELGLLTPSHSRGGWGGGGGIPPPPLGYRPRSGKKLCNLAPT